jgi:predicted metal-dependent peptidase
MSTEEDFTDEYKALSKAKVALMGIPALVFFTTVLLNFKTLITRSVPTAAVDSTTIYFNPDFLMKLTPPQRVFVLLHEVMHVVFMHTCRRGERDARIWNYAGDYVINYYIRHMVELVGHIEMPQGLYDPKYAGMTTNQVYDLLMQDPPPPSDQDMLDIQENEDATPEEVEQKVDQVLMQASIVAEQSARENSEEGTPLPQEIQIYLDSLKSPKLPWNRVLQKFMNESAKVEYSFKRPNRRFFPEHILPTASGRGLDHMALAIDVSGSITDDELLQFVSEVYSIIQSTKPKVVTVILFHHRIVSATEVRSVQDLMGIDMKGRGGTLVTPVMEWAEENKPQGMLIFTDGWIEKDYPILKIPTRWIIYDNPSFKPSFGQAITYPLNG